MDKQEQRTITTTNGMVVPLRAVSQTYIAAADTRVAADYRKRGEPVDPPTYTVDLAGGSPEVHPHDETTLEVLAERTGISDPAEAAAEAARRTAENRAAWKLHVEAVARMKSDQARATSRVLLETGIDIELPDDEGWMVRQRRAGVEIPTDADDRRYHWLTSEVLVTPDDLMNAIETITTLSFRGAMEEADVAAAMSTFRGRVQRSADRELAPGRLAVAIREQARGAPDGESLGAGTAGVEGAAVP